jgi:hypothetical protein
MCEGSEDVVACNVDCAADNDADGAFVYDDCNDGDASSTTVPGEVVHVLTQGAAAPYRFLWDSLGYSAGSGTVYDIYSGLLSDLEADAGLQSGACLSDDLAATLLVDPTSSPPSGGGYYFTIRGQNGCAGGTGTYGSALRDTTHDLSGNSCN